MSEPFDLDKHLAAQARARALGMDYSEIRTIILSVGADGDDGISEGRAVELIREMALRAVDKAVAEERAAVVAWLGRPHAGGCHVTWCEACEERAYAAGAIERGEHLKGEP
jgi:hypothetical protein